MQKCEPVLSSSVTPQGSGANLDEEDEARGANLDDERHEISDDKSDNEVGASSSGDDTFENAAGDGPTDDERAEKSNVDVKPASAAPGSPQPGGLGIRGRSNAKCKQTQGCSKRSCSRRYGAAKPETPGVHGTMHVHVTQGNCRDANLISRKMRKVTTVKTVTGEQSLAMEYSDV